MKKTILIFVAVFTFNSFTSLNASSNNIEDAIIETASPSCWNGANAAEIYVCGSVGCNFDLWAAVYSACMGYDDQDRE
jgi:hypothetical protein